MGEFGNLVYVVWLLLFYFIHVLSQMYNGIVLSSELAKLAEEAENDASQLENNLNAIDTCGTGMRNNNDAGQV